MTMANMKPKYETPTGLSFANIRRGRNDIYEQIFEQYCPTIPVDLLSNSQRVELGYEDLSLGSTEPMHKACAEAKAAASVYVKASEDEEPRDVSFYCPHNEPAALVPDPEVIYVGRLIDGLVFSGVLESRKIGKNLINNIPAGRTFRESGTAGQFTGGGVVKLEFKAVEPRREMYEALARGVFNDQPTIKKLIENGEAPTINMGTIIKDAEPGEILNSPDVVKSEDVASGEIDMWEAGNSEFTFSPKIRLDNRFGLHYLKRGYQVTISGAGWPRPRVQEFKHKWVLRPPSEGRSLVQQDAGGDDIVQLSNMRA